MLDAASHDADERVQVECVRVAADLPKTRRRDAYLDRAAGSDNVTVRENARAEIDRLKREGRR